MVLSNGTAVVVIVREVREHSPLFEKQLRRLCLLLLTILFWEPAIQKSADITASIYIPQKTRQQGFQKHTVKAFVSEDIQFSGLGGDISVGGGAERESPFRGRLIKGLVPRIYFSIKLYVLRNL